MNYSRLGWGLWALVPVAAISYHYGPGQAEYALDVAARLSETAGASAQQAQEAQDRAYAMHLKAIEARRAAFLDPTTENRLNSASATTSEEELYASAATAWDAASDQYQEVLTALGSVAPNAAREVRWAKAKADVRSGDIWTATEDLETLVTELNDTQSGDKALEAAAREELATAYYYGARLLRLSGMPAQEWQVESGKARQHFRYLAEQDGAESAVEHQRNLELVLNLEQSTLVELQGKPLPKDSPCNGKVGNRPCNKKGKSQRPPQNKDGRGAGGAEAIRSGW